MGGAARARPAVVFVHGDDDTFVPLAADQRIAAEYGHTLITVPDGDHFLNACCVPALLGAMEQAIAEAEGSRGIAASGHMPAGACRPSIPIGSLPYCPIALLPCLRLEAPLPFFRPDRISKGLQPWLALF